ncbi:MAG: hypothetical protein E7614_01265 [Ruminococcaceae bacterium]|nr:hypothetical protein [Oscillospiraceae bacterium]
MRNNSKKTIIEKTICFLLAFCTVFCAFPFYIKSVSRAEAGEDRNYALGATYEYSDIYIKNFCEGYGDLNAEILNDGEILYEETEGKTLMLKINALEVTFDLGKVYDDVYRIDICGVMDMWGYNLTSNRNDRSFSVTKTEIMISENGVDYTSLKNLFQWGAENHKVDGVKTPYYDYLYQLHFKTSMRYVKIKCYSATDFISLSEIRIMGTDKPVGISGTLYNDIKWTLSEEGKLDITGSGVIANDFCKTHGDKVRSITVAQGITSITNDAFKNFRNAESVWLADSVTELGDGIFKYFKNLKTVRLSSKMTMIPNQTFSGCSSIETIELPKGIKEIGSGAFMSCKSLENIVLPEGLKVINGNAFLECYALKTINLPQSLISVNTAFSFSGIYSNPDYWDDGALYVDNILLYAAKDLSGEYIVKPSTRMIAGNAFVSNTALKKVVIPKGVEYICEEAFENCSSLTSVYIPNTVTTIEKRAFFGCDSLKNVIVPSSVEAVGDYAFGYKSTSSLVYNFSINGTVGSVMDDYAWDNGIPFNKIPLTEIPESDYYVDTDSMTMKNMKEQVSVSQLKSDLTDVVGIYDKNGKAVSSGYIGTGFSVTTSSGNKYKVIISGDVNGSGEIDSTDYLQIKSMFLGELSLENEFFSAADTDKNGYVNSTDYLKIKKYLLLESIL